MKCPYCKNDNDHVVDSRSSENGWAIRRRRECSSCGRRFTTYEKSDQEVRLRVVKKDGSRVPYDSERLLHGLHLACHKRPVPEETIQRIVREIEEEVVAEYDQEVPSSVLGEKVMSRLAELDQVAYVRFASVYRAFADVSEFVSEVQSMARSKKTPPKGGS